MNEFECEGEVLVLGDAWFRTTFESHSSRLDDDGSLTVLGDFEYRGGPGRDQVLLNGVGTTGSTIGGDATIDLGDGDATGQAVFMNIATARVGGDLTIESDADLGTDQVILQDSIVGGDVVVDLGKGPNSATLRSYPSGTSFVQLQILMRASNKGFSLSIVATNMTS